MSSLALQTFLFISIKEVAPPIVQDLVRRKEGPLASEIARAGGRVFDVAQQQVRAVFASTSDAVQALLAAQQKLSAFALAYSGAGTLSAAIHRGSCIVTGTSYEGETLRYVRYLLAAAHPGQYLLSAAAYEDLGAEPPAHLALVDLGTQRLKDLTFARRVYQLGAAGSSVEFPLLHTLDRRPHNLPVLASSLVGRDLDVEYLARLLAGAKTRIVSLLGPSGTGKSRLSFQVMAELLEDFEHGCYFVALAAIDSGQLLLPAIAQAIGVRASPSRPLLETLKSSLQERQLLLVLDNFEQLVEHAAIVGELIAGAPRLKVIVTTQIPLGLPEERVVELPPLGLPSSARFAVVEHLIRFPAVALFAERARANCPDFEVTGENAEAVAAICLQLDGLPLAIELVAAYSDRFSPAEMLLQLQSRVRPASVSTSGPPLAQTRQQMLLTVLEWSYGLLGADAQLLFTQLGVFVGGGTAEQVAIICGSGTGPDHAALADPVAAGAVINSHMEELFKRNLLLDDGRGAGPVARWSMLDMVHDYAQLALGQAPDAPALRDRHAAYFLRLLLQAETELSGPRQNDWLDTIEREYPNLRVALCWLEEQGRLEEALSWFGVVWRFWQYRGYHSEGRFWTERLLAQARQVVAPTQELLTARAKALCGAGWLCNDLGEYDAGLRLFEESVALADAQGDERTLGMALQGVGSLAQLQGDVARARGSFERSRDLFRRLGDREESAWVLDHLGLLERRQGNLDAAERDHVESMALFKEVGHEWGLALALNHLARVLLEQGDAAGASAALRPWVEQRRGLGTDHGSEFLLALAALGEAEMYLGNLPEAEQIFERCMEACRKAGYTGRIAMLYDSLGLLGIRQGNYAKARQAFCESLRLQQELKERSRIIRLLGWVAELAVAQQDYALAARLAGAAAGLRRAGGVVLTPVQQQALDAVIAAARAGLGSGAFEDSWAEGELLSLEQVLELGVAQLCQG